MNARLLSFPFLLLLASLLSYVFSITLYAAPQDFRIRSHEQAYKITTEDDIRSEIEFGQNIAARILGTMPIYNNPRMTRYVNLVGRALAANAGRPEIAFHFAILDLENINAYSTPGGYVFITRGAIRQMRDEAELAAVISHEIAHITQKHIVNEFKIKAKDDSSISSVSRLVGGSSDSARVAFYQAVDKAMEMLLTVGFKHQDEMDADNVATLLMMQTGYDPHALYRFLERAQQASNENAALKSQTHPATTDRINEIKNIIKKEGLDDLHLPRGEKRFNKYVKF